MNFHMRTQKLQYCLFVYCYRNTLQAETNNLTKDTNVALKDISLKDTEDNKEQVAD